MASKPAGRCAKHAPRPRKAKPFGRWAVGGLESFWPSGLYYEGSCLFIGVSSNNKPKLTAGEKRKLVAALNRASVVLKVRP
jgi:hypothetical protein